MINKQKIEIEGVDCWFAEPNDCEKFLAARKNLNRNDKCALTNEELDKNGFYIIINNYKLFPNCFANKKTVDKIGLKEATKQIGENWQAARNFRHWFE